MVAPAGLRPLIFGVISDTHGKLDARVAVAFRGVDAILHAGDVGGAHVLAELERIAPVTAVSGNMDRTRTPHALLEDHQVVEANGARIRITHERGNLRRWTPDAEVVVFGHSHRALVEADGDVLWVNPGSASSPRGAAMGATVALLEVGGVGAVGARIVPLSEVDDA